MPETYFVTPCNFIVDVHSTEAVVNGARQNVDILLLTLLRPLEELLGLTVTLDELDEVDRIDLVQYDVVCGTSHRIHVFAFFEGVDVTERFACAKNAQLELFEGLLVELGPLLVFQGVFLV